MPVVTSSAAASGRSGPVYLALGLSVSFAVAGTLLTLLLVSLGLDPELFRYVAATLLVGVALALLVPALNDRATMWLSSLSGKLNLGGSSGSVSAPGQFGVGALLGVVWLPCVGPSLGGAIALASMGQNLTMAFLAMLAYGIGTAGVLLLAGLLSGRILTRWRSRSTSCPAGCIPRRLRRTVGGAAGLGTQSALPRRLTGFAGAMMRIVLFVCALGLLIGAAWIGSHAVYHSWHPCDWLLQDTVDRVLERRGIDPDTASIPLKAEVSEAPEVRTVLRLRSTPLQCVSTWAAGRIFP